MPDTMNNGAPNGAVKWMGDNFPFFCRRVCRQCNRTDTTRLMLLECPIIKLDAYAYLRRKCTTAKISVVLRAAIEEIVTDELVWDVSHIRRPDITTERESQGEGEN